MPLCFPYLIDSCLFFRSGFGYNLQAGVCVLFFLFLWENPKLFPIFALSGVVLKVEYTSPCVSLALSEGPWGPNYFHNKTKMLFRFFIVLTFAYTVQKPWWVKLLVLASNDLEVIMFFFTNTHRKSKHTEITVIKAMTKNQFYLRRSLMKQ